MGRSTLFEELTAVLPAQRVRPLLIAIDGPDGVGKTTFARGWAEHLRAGGVASGVEVVLASVDDFHHPREYRHRLGRRPEDVWSRHFDYRALRARLLEPWLSGPGATYWAAIHDVHTDEAVTAAGQVVPADAILIVEGVFLQRPELKDAWDFVVFLDAPFEVTAERMIARGDNVDNRERYVAAQQHYFSAHSPHDAADVLIDHSDLTRPDVRRAGVGSSYEVTTDPAGGSACPHCGGTLES